ncbi:MAG: hypothetical protein MJ213_01130 [Bacilli bacterium]|nr:hypothetical protein [Bacilli bacterium]
MKNIIKVSSLGLVALLASCSSNTIAPLKKINPETAMAVVQSICSNQESTKDKELNKKPEMKQNDIFYKDYFPYTMTSMSADITIRNTNKSQTTSTFALTEEDETIIKKHIYFNMKNLFYHAHMSMTYTSNKPIKETYPDVDYYFFFIEDKEQDEETVKTEYDKKGTFYGLVNVSGLMKFTALCINDFSREEAAYELQYLFEENNPILSIKNSSPSFNISEALSYTLVSPITNWNFMDALYKEIEGPGFTDESPKMLIMYDWFDDHFDDTVDEFEDFRDRMKALEDENSYFNYVFRSNDASSLGIEADAHLGINDTYEGYTVTGYMQEVTSLIFRDLYLSESHFAINNEANATTKMSGIEMTAYTSLITSCDQYIEYNTNENDTYPSDYLEYNPGI